MSKEITKMNLIAIVQQLASEDIEVVETYIRMIEKENQLLKQRIDKAIEIVEKYNLGKFDYSIPPVGIIELLEKLKGIDEECI